MLLLQLFAVDIGIDNLGFFFQRNDVIVGNGGRNEAGIAFAKGDFVARCAYFYFTIAFDTEWNDEAVIFQKVAMEGRFGVDYAQIEIAGGEHYLGLERLMDVGGALVVIAIIVQSIVS